MVASTSWEAGQYGGVLPDMVARFKAINQLNHRSHIRTSINPTIVNYLTLICI